MALTDLEPIRKSLETFNEEIEREQYENFSGQKDDIDTDSIYARYASVFENEALVDEVWGRRSFGSPADGARMQYLYGYLVGGYIGRRTTAVDDRLNVLQAKAEIDVDGRKMPFRFSSVALANEPDHAKREAIDRAREPVFAELNPLFRERLDRAYQIAGNFGYDSYQGMCEDVKGIDLEALGAQMQGFLHRTDRLYTRYFRDLCKNVLGLGLADVRKHDVGFLFRAPDLDRFFAADRMMKVMDDTLDGMGLQLSEHPNIHVDAEAREKKRPRAFCSAIRVPDDVVLCIRPQGGMDDYRALFHEMGHAQHFGNISPGLAFEFKYLGDIGLSETYAFLFDHLPDNRNWLARHFELTEEDMTHITRFTAFHLLFMIRRYAAKLLYELELHAGAPNPGRLYAQYLGDALKFRHPENQYLYDVDTGFYCADYLRAWMLEVQLRGRLAEEFGTEWWNSRGAGGFLKALWRDGQKLDCDRMAQNLGYFGIDEFPLVKELEKSLRY
jgi:hypothetical protein